MYRNILDAIGNTPLVKVNFSFPAQFFAKLEYANPGGSLKDRSALYMIEQAEKQGIIKPGSMIIEASSGNQGIATAMIGAFKGYKVTISVSEKISKEKMDTIRGYGATIVINKATDRLEDPESYHACALRLHQENSGSFMLNQYFNVANTQAHYYSLGPEIWKQTEGKITHLFAAAGSGGHVSGAGKFLKEKNPNIKIIAIDSINSWYATKGNPKPYYLEGIGIDFASPLLDLTVIDEVIGVSDADAIDMLKFMARTKGFLLGPSSGAVAYVAHQYAAKLPETAMCVAVFGDSGRAYLTKNFY